MNDTDKKDLINRLDIIIRMANRCKELIMDDDKYEFNEELNSERFSIGIEISHFNKKIFPLIRIGKHKKS